MGVRNENRHIIRFDIGNAINEVIELSGYMKKDVAKQLNISPSTLTGYISNNRIPDIFTLLKLCEVCNVEPNHLFGFNRSDYLMDKEEKILINQLREFDANDKQRINKHLMETIRFAIDLKNEKES